MNFVFETTGPKNKNVKGFSLIEQRVDLVTSSESLINSNIILSLSNKERPGKTVGRQDPFVKLSENPTIKPI